MCSLGQKLRAPSKSYIFNSSCCKTCRASKRSKVLELSFLWVLTQVKIAEHVLTGHKVAIKILHRKKIKAMDMEEKGEWLHMLPWPPQRYRWVVPK